MKVGMVLEGGSLRGIFTTGVIDTLLENEILIDAIVSVSAGALFGVNYFSKQRGRGIRYNKKYFGKKNYISTYSLITTGNLVNKDFTFYKINKELDPFDDETFINSNKDFYVTATNINSGSPEYFKINSVLEQLEEFRASSALPFMSEIIKINGESYLDGGISDSIPLDKCLSLGCDKVIVVLTQPDGFRKRPYSKKMIEGMKIRYHKYPKLIDTVKNRYVKYNETLDKIYELERDGKIFVIRPSREIDLTFKNCCESKLDEIYQMGINDSKKIIKELKEYLDK